MSGYDGFMLLSAIVGGLALFIFGMNIMADGLRKAAGNHLRTILQRTTDNRFAGVFLGSVLGFLIHSSAATVMLVGFVNAGLTTLSQSVPAMLGANIGTTLSMQMISFKLDRYCFFAIAIGFIIQLMARRQHHKAIGRSIMGFGLLFLGMSTMSGAIKPHREALAPLLASVDGTTLPGMLIGIGISTLITSIIQSSGATIGMCYALISAGVFTELVQVYPILLGAHIGTCATAMLGSIGTNIEARRTAVSHLLFNVLKTIMAASCMRFFLWLVPKTADDLIHQMANLNTAIVLVASVPILAIPTLYARLVRFIVFSRKPRPQPSHLDDSLLTTPEKAIAACILELRRVSQMTAESLRINGNLFFEADRRAVRTIRMNEAVINEIKLSMRSYLGKIAQRTLSQRQVTMVRRLDRCVIDIERIGDHVEELCDLSIERGRIPDALFDVESFEAMFDLYRHALGILRLVIDSLAPDTEVFGDIATAILKDCQSYKEKSVSTEESFRLKVRARIMAPRTNVIYGRYLLVLDRIVRHAREVARMEADSDFKIKPRKLDIVAEHAPHPEPPELVDSNKMLDSLD